MVLDALREMPVGLDGPYLRRQRIFSSLEMFPFGSPTSLHNVRKLLLDKYVMYVSPGYLTLSGFHSPDCI